MNAFEWGLCGPGTLPTSSRARTLGIARSVRVFNELAVPGLGNAWFCKQLLLATLGVAVADSARQMGKKVTNIAVTNAVEALACWMAYKHNKWQADSRLRGRAKMQGRTDLSYDVVRKSNFYVTQPMRMATVQPLVALGLVDSEAERFNAFSCSVDGYELLDQAFGGFRPRGGSVLNVLAAWVAGDSRNVHTNPMSAALNPTLDLEKPAREFLQGRIAKGNNANAKRRRAALAWVASVNGSQVQTWRKKPASIDADHWKDLCAGGAFFRARDAALDVLEAVETHLSRAQSPRLPPTERLSQPVIDSVDKLRALAIRFKDLAHDPTPGREAAAFCNECLKDDPRRVVQALVLRDERVLRLRDGAIVIVPGSGRPGRPRANSEGPDADETNAPGIRPPGAGSLFPRGISRRIDNLYLLNLDLQGKLEPHLRAQREIRTARGAE